MRLFLSPFLLAGQLVGSSETGDLRGLVDVLTEQQTQLEATIDELRTDFSELKEKYDALVASTTAQRHDEAQWQRETTEKLQSLAGRRRLTSAVSTQRRGLSSDTCADPSGPALLVEGVCSCTGGLLVAGRNVTKELDELAGLVSLTDSTCPIFDTCVLVDTLIDDFHLDGAHKLALSPNGLYLYAASTDNHGVSIVNVTDLHNVTVIGAVLEDLSRLKRAVGIALSPCGNFAYVTSVDLDSVAVVNVTNPLSPTVVGFLQDSVTLNYAFSVAASPNGTYVYVVSSQSDGVATIDVTDPTNPIRVGYLGDNSKMDGALGLALSPDGGYAYVASVFSDSLAVVDVSNPINPVLAGAVVNDDVNLNGAESVAVAPDGDFVYVVGRDSDSLAVVNVTNPETPTVVGSIVGDSTNMDLVRWVAASADGLWVFVAGRLSNTIAIVNVTDKTNPTIASTFTDDNMLYPYGIHESLDGNHLFIVASDSNSLEVLQWRNCKTSNRRNHLMDAR